MILNDLTSKIDRFLNLKIQIDEIMQRREYCSRRNSNLLLLFKEYKKKLKIVGKTSCVRPFEFHETLDLPFFRRD